VPRGIERHDLLDGPPRTRPRFSVSCSSSPRASSIRKGSVPGSNPGGAGLYEASLDDSGEFTKARSFMAWKWYGRVQPPTTGRYRSQTGHLPRLAPGRDPLTPFSASRKSPSRATARACRRPRTSPGVPGPAAAGCWKPSEIGPGGAADMRKSLPPWARTPAMPTVTGFNAPDRFSVAASDHPGRGDVGPDPILRRS
jgi:hypothetical protein